MSEATYNAKCMKVTSLFYRSSGQYVSALMQEDNNIPRCLYSLFNHLNLRTSTSKECVLLSQIKNSDGMAAR